MMFDNKKKTDKTSISRNRLVTSKIVDQNGFDYKPFLLEYGKSIHIT